MSINIFITAQRPITFTKKNGEVGNDIQVLKFDALQTPTDVSWKIVGSKAPLQEYVEWVMEEFDIDEQVATYDDEDNFVEFIAVNYAKIHLEELTKWVDEVEDNGYKVVFSAC